MQTVACDISGKIISIPQARRRETYFCMHCHGRVRKRGGLFFKPHFYHLTQGTLCHPQKRSSLHLKIQNFIQQQFPDEKFLLEVPFHSVGRIADIVWPAKRLIFEVQCSPISRWEVMGRIEDYMRVRYQVVWIFLADRFYRKKLSEVEKSVLYSPYFFITEDLHCFVDHGSLYRDRRLPKREPVCFTPFDLQKITRIAGQRSGFFSSKILECYQKLLTIQTSP